MRVAAMMIALCVALATAVAAQEPAVAPRPNIVFILADDLGWGDLGSYGASDIATPSLDRLAREGVRFTDFYSVANTCSPSRAALMTGRYPARSGVNGVLFHDTPDGLPQHEITIPELLRAAGYRTAMIGKWHLGSADEFMPWNHGFTEFFGVPHSNDQENFFVWDGRRRLSEPVDQSRLIRRYTDRALAFLASAASSGEPFFLYVAYNAPHIPLYPSDQFRGRSRRGTYGDVVEELDASIGELMARLAELGIDRNTLVAFASDNGPWLAMRDWGGSAGGLRGGKTSTFEGGQRVPAVVRWPGVISAGRTVSTVADMMDWLPTFAELAGVPVPGDRVVDGRSLVGTLEAHGERASRPFYYFTLRMPFDDQRPKVGAVRDGRWKLKLPQSGYYPEILEPIAKAELYRHGQLLFDLEADPGERRDVSAEHPDVVRRLSDDIARFEASLDPAVPVRMSAAPYDHTGWERLWQGLALVAGMMATAVGLVIVGVVLLIRRLRRRRIRPLVSVLCVVALLTDASASASTRCPGATWVGAWAAPPSDASGAGAPPFVLNGQTVRATLTPTAKGSMVRVRLSNRFRTTPVTFERVTIARQASGAGIVRATLRKVRFGRRRSVELQPDADVVSDAVRLRVRPFEALAVSVYVAEDVGGPTKHDAALQTSYLTDPGAGDATRDVRGTRFTKTTLERPWVTGLDVRTRRSTGAVVAVGDSLTDGVVLLPVGAGFPGVAPGAVDANVRYPDFLARRILNAGLPLSVLNAGIAGNMLLGDALQGGAPLVSRILVDVLGQSGVTTVILWIGINDIAFFTPLDQLVQGYETIIRQMQHFGLRVLQGTVTPFKGFPGLIGFFEQLEPVRDAVNEWIRTQSPTDGVIDFDLAVRDTVDPDRLNPAYDDGEHLHFSPDGYRRLAEAVPLDELALPPCRRNEGP